MIRIYLASFPGCRIECDTGDELAYVVESIPELAHAVSGEPLAERDDVGRILKENRNDLVSEIMIKVERIPGQHGFIERHHVTELLSGYLPPCAEVG